MDSLLLYPYIHQLQNLHSEILLESFSRSRYCVRSLKKNNKKSKYISYQLPIMQFISIILLTCLQLVSAHFSIDYPYWRGDSFTAPASQYTRPCKSFPPIPSPQITNTKSICIPSSLTIYTPPGAGVNQSLSNTNRTLWPLTGGSVVLHVSHPWAITYVNLGLGGDNTTVFNISLVPNFNQTGNGTFCLPAIKLPSNVVVSNGTQASLQVIQIGETGGSLYNVNFPPSH